MTASVGTATIRVFIDRNANIQPDAPFLISPESGRVLTCLDLQQQCILLSARLGEFGLRRGDKVAFLLDNGLFAAQLFLGAMYGGFVVVPLNVRAGVVQLAYMLEHCDTQVVFVEKQYCALLGEALTAVRRPIRVVTATADDLVGDPGTARILAPPEIPAEYDVAMLIYSSGSVGHPKGALHTQRSIVAQGRNVAATYDLTARDRSLLVLPLYHVNAECVTLIPTLLTAGSVVVPHRFSVSQFWDWMEEHRCTWSALVPTIISELVCWEDPKAEQRAATLGGIRFLRSSSAPLAPALQREFIDKFKLPLLQAMGSTEAGNIFSNPLPPRENKIGSPGVPWGFEARIVDGSGADVREGDSGEVLLRGTALMSGYYKDPEGTAAALSADGWLRTGDLACRDRDGYYFIVGRSKEIIIKAGVNIAPRQIDDVLESHPGVFEAAAVGVPDRHLGEDVIAFVVPKPDANLDEHELLSFCEQRLGHFKAPTRIRFASDLPKGPSGKVQRLRLLEPPYQAASLTSQPVHGSGGKASRFYEALSIEEVIGAAWAELLGIASVDPHSNFFALGGHSLLAIQCLSRLRDRLPVALTLSDFFEHGTISRLADLVRQRLRQAAGPQDQTTQETAAWEANLLRQAATPAGPSIPRHESSQRGPLSAGQERLWFMQKIIGGAPVYNEAEAARLRGSLDVEILERAVNEIVARHDILRSTIAVSEGVPHAVVHEQWPLRIKKIDLSALAPAARESAVNRLLVEEPRAPYDLETEPAIRVTLVRLGAADHVLILMMHHIIADWGSEGVFWRELSTLYRAHRNRQPAVLPDLPIQYGDYAAWRQKQLENPASFADDLAYWEETLRGAPPVLELPADRPRPAALSYRGGRIRWKVNGNLTTALREAGQRANASLFTLMAAALNVLLYRYTQSEDILLGIPLGDRDEKELQGLIGFLLHTHVLRTRFSGDTTFRGLVALVQKGVLDLYSHRLAPFDQVVRKVQPQRNASYSPLFQVMLNWRDRDQQFSLIGLDGLEVESLMAESGTSKFDLLLFATDCGDEIWLEMEYSFDLFDEARIVRMLGHYQAILESAVAGPESRVREMPLLTAAERQELAEWNARGVAWPSDSYLQELIDQQAAARPDAIAVCFESSRLTYRELIERAEVLAAELRRHGIRRGELAGICLERSVDLVVGLLGILKAGGAYLPLDPSYPRERVEFMLQDAGPRAVVTQRGCREKISAYRGPVVELDSLTPGKRAVAPLETGRDTTDPAYVLYTSGSSGKPKGVQISHRALVNLLRSTQQEPGCSAQDTLLAVTTLSFDIAGLEIFLPLISGGCVVIAPSDVVGEGARLSELMERSGATMMQATPATWRLLLDSGWRGNPGLKILCGGEAWHAELAERLLPRCASLWNMYGPTETTIWSAVARVEKNQPVRIGRPIANTRLYVLDQHQQLLPSGIPGELFIAGDGLASGYLQRPQLTAERFVPDPFVPGARMYRTGDLVRYHAGGSIEFVERMDQQVKVRGFRVELGEIETSIEQCAGVKQCVVVLRGDDVTDHHLAAFVVPAEAGSPPTSAGLRGDLKGKLPGYMIPGSFAFLDGLPLTANGKIDRRALSRMESPPPQAASSSQQDPKTLLEVQLLDIWRRILRARVESVQDDFFEIGGHSLLAVRLITEVNQTFQSGVTIPAFLQAPTIRGMSNLLQQASGQGREPKLVRLRAGAEPGAMFMISSGLGVCRLGQSLENTPSVYTTVVPFAVSGTGLPALKKGGAPPSLAEIAAAYIEIIAPELGEGPCVLVGHSFTGLLAFEIAHQLIRKGQPVEMVVLLDSWAANPSLLQKLKRLPPAQIHSRLLARIKRIGSSGVRRLRRANARLPEAAAPPETRYETFDEMSLFPDLVRHALKGHRLKPLECRAVLFRAQHSHKADFHGIEPTLGWGGLFTRGLDVVDLAGDHSSILYGRQLAVLGEMLQAHLNAALKKPPQNSQNEASRVPTLVA